MGERVIKHIESFSAGKSQGHNDDAIYIGRNFAAVIDGVSHKSSVLVNGKEVKIAEIITQAIEMMDEREWLKEQSFEKIVEFINLYIEKYLKRAHMEEVVGKIEAAGVIYSKFHNQIWLVGDCKAIYDGKVAQNPLKIDEVVVHLRQRIVNALLSEGYSEQDLMNDDISLKIIKNPSSLKEYIKSPQLIEEIEVFRRGIICQALLDCGFTQTQIEEEGLIEKYYNPRNLQKVLKNNPNMGAMGYAVFNGIRTEIKNCKVVNLPIDVRDIKMFSDGFPVDALNNNEDLGYAVKEIRARAKKDKLSIKDNKGVHNSVRYSKMENRIEEYAIDDATAVIIRIEGNDIDKNDKGR